MDYWIREPQHPIKVFHWSIKKKQWSTKQITDAGYSYIDIYIRTLNDLWSAKK